MKKYLKVDGVYPMENNLDLDGYNIKNVISINGSSIDDVIGIAGHSPGLFQLGTKPIIRDETITIFASGHGFVGNTGGSQNLNNTSDYCLGYQSVSGTTDGAGTAKTIKKVGLSSFDATDYWPVVSVKVPDHTYLAGFELYFGDSSLANYFKFEMKNSSSQKWLTADDWHVMTLPWGSLGTSGGSPDAANITDYQFRIVDDATGTAVTCQANLIGYVKKSSEYPNGVVSFSFDDADETVYTAAKPILDSYGYSATAYVVRDYIGETGSLTLAQCHELERISGWEISAHATTGDIHSARFTSLTDDELEAECLALRAWLSSNGFRGDTIAFPGGVYTESTVKICEKYFTACRTIHQNYETLPPARRGKIRTNGYMSSSKTVADITAMIDKAYANGEWLNIVCHAIVDSVSLSTDVLATTLDGIAAYCASKGIPVKTIGDVIHSRV